MLIVWAETTRGVYQASGYGDVNADKSIWFVPSNLGVSLFLLLSVFHRQVLVLRRTHKS